MKKNSKFSNFPPFSLFFSLSDVKLSGDSEYDVYFELESLKRSKNGLEKKIQIFKKLKFQRIYMKIRVKTVTIHEIHGKNYEISIKSTFFFNFGFEIIGGKRG